MYLRKKRDEAPIRFRLTNRLQLLACLAAFVFPAFVLFSPAQSAAQSTQSGDQPLLTAGVLITRDLSGGQSHSYQITLTAGQYLRIVVEQRGCDVAVALVGADESLQAEADFDRSLRGKETLALITRSAGSHRLNVQAKGKLPGRYVLKVEELRPALPQDADRVNAYRLQMEARQLAGQQTAATMRQAAEKYEAARAAWRALGDQASEAATLLPIGKLQFDLGDEKKTLAAWEQALTLWRALGRSREEAQTLSELGLLSYLKSEQEQALALYNQALPLHRAASDLFWEAETLNRLGWVYNAKDEAQQTLAMHQAALPLRQAAEDRIGEGVTLNDIGRAYDNLGEKQQAIEAFNHALKIRSANEDRAGVASVLIRLGAVYDSMGEWQPALDAYNQALAILETIHNPRATASALNNIGLVYTNLGEYRQALNNYERALKLCRESGLRSGEATTLNNIGNLYRAARELPQAIEYHGQALAAFKTLNTRAGQAQALLSLGVVSYEMGDARRALGFYEQALTLRRALNDRHGEAATLSSIGVAWLALGDAQQAHDHLSQALPLQRAVSDRAGEAETLLGLARSQYELGDAVAARAALDQSLQLTESMRAGVAGQGLRASYFATVQRRYEQGIDLLMRLARHDAGQQAAALQLSERARARSLLELLTEARADIRQGADPVLLAKERALRQQLNARAAAQTRLLSGKHSEQQAATMAAQVADLTTMLRESETQLRVNSPRYAALTQPLPLTAAEIQQLLDDDTLLLEYALGEKASYLWAVTPTSIIAHQLPPRAEIEAVARRVYELLTARQPQPGLGPTQQLERVKKAEAEYAPQAAALSRMLLAPVAAQLGNKRLVIVASGMLEYLPFAALPEPPPNGKADGPDSKADGPDSKADGPDSKADGPDSKADGKDATAAAPLLARHEVVNLPSASVLAALRRETAAKTTATKTVAVLADPVFTPDDPRVRVIGKNRQGAEAATSAALAANRAAPAAAPPATDLARAVRDFGAERGSLARLPFSREEAEAILSLTPPGAGLKALSFQANRQTATNPDLSQYRIVHFATHGLLNSEHPELSGLVFSLVDEAGKAQDGFLRLHEIYNLRLPADLIVLSACQTALGKQVKGEGLVGLTRGFMYAGAPRVVASLWQVNDLATAELMKRFYRGLLKERLRPAAALRAAQLALLKQKQWAAPYYWAAFVLQGEWR